MRYGRTAIARRNPEQKRAARQDARLKLVVAVNRELQAARKPMIDTTYKMTNDGLTAWLGRLRNARYELENAVRAREGAQQRNRARPSGVRVRAMETAHG